jgi:hypothetical protein
MTKPHKTTAKTTATATGSGATIAVAVLAAAEFLPPDLVAELSEKITAGGLTITSIVTAVLVFLISRNHAKVKDLTQRLDELIDDAETPPDPPGNDAP